MQIKILGRFQKPASNAKSRAYLIWDDWNDYSFYTLFGLLYVDENSVRHEIGSIKIGYHGQEEGYSERGLSIGDEFDKLDEAYFSLGQSDSYYTNLNAFGETIRDEILLSLRDIARLPELYKVAILENVTKVSLLRSISPITVTGQFRRIATGGSRLTPYSFEFKTLKSKENAKGMELSFKVEPGTYPPTNIHVVIGRNGVGKTYLMNNMINSLVDNDINKSRKYGRFVPEFNDEGGRLFANLISVSFSAFDEYEPKPEVKDKTRGIQYSYIGLKRVQSQSDKNSGPKSTAMLKNEFYFSLSNCRNARKGHRWQQVIEMLESDPMFEEAGIKSLIEIQDEDEFKTKVSESFIKLSSGHKIVLLSITRLVETLQERSLVLIDEPEAHLHPPLLSTFVRALSELLISTNGVAIIATHSPVILQEVPKGCVFKLRRAGAVAVAERLVIESFGENVGVLTNEIFGLEITKSGFYNLLNETIEESEDYNEVIERFNNNLGMEARAIIMSRFASKQ